MKKRVKEKKKIARVIKNILIIGILLLVFLIVLDINLYVKTPIKEVPFKGGGSLGTIGVFSTNIPPESNIIKENCSDDNLKEIWDFGFMEGLDNIVILAAKDSNDMCNFSLMYKILDNNLTYFVYIRYDSLQNQNGFIYGNIGNALFVYGNFSENITNALRQTNVSNYYNFVDLIPNNDFISEIGGFRDIEGIDSANNEYHSIFRTNNGSWQTLDNDSYSFEMTNPSNNLDNFIMGAIFKNITFDSLSYTERYTLPINLTQTSNIPDFVLNANEFRTDAIDLDNYFVNLGIEDTNLSFSYSPLRSEFQIQQGTDFFNMHKIDFNASNLIGVWTVNISLSYPGLNNVTSNNFNVSIVNINTTANCTDSDGGQIYSLNGVTINSSENKTDVCYNSTNLREFYCNGSLIIESIVPCSVNYSCSNGECVWNITVPIIPPPTIPPNTTIDFKITNPVPAEPNVSVSKLSKTLFMIGNSDYDNILWYLDGVLLKNSTNFFEAVNLTVGNHTVKVEIKSGVKMDSRVWLLNVKDDESPNNNFNATTFLFWIIIVVTLIIIILFVVLIIIQKSEGKGKIGDGRVVSSKESPVLDLNPVKSRVN